MANHVMICLTDAEVRICTWVGRQRFANARSNARDPGKGWRSLTVESDIDGVKGEWATAIALNLYWRPAVGQIDQPDVGGFLEVRATPYRDGHLIIKPDEVGPFVLAINIDDHIVRVCGWYEADLAKQQFPLRHGPGDDGHWVPQHVLRDLSELCHFTNALTPPATSRHETASRETDFGA